MQVKLLCQKYLNALNEGSLDRVLSLFEKNAVVLSPLYGEMSAETFYRNLFVDTNKSETKLIQIFESTDNHLSCAMFFHYKWVLSTGKTVEFDCVDVFDLTSDRSQFAKLKIIYDTAFVRPELTSRS
jgi:hypothetical protein